MAMPKAEFHNLLRVMLNLDLSALQAHGLFTAAQRTPEAGL